MAMSTKASKKLFQTTTILSGAFTLLTVVQSANALPTGGNVVGGNANITSAANRIDVNQSTNRAVINWNNFDVGAGEQVNFNQPSSSSVTLNRVVNSNAPSQIYGKLTANGNVVIVNSQGVLFGKGAQVNVGGLVATTADVDNNDFMKGNLNFSKAGNPNAKIQNDGNIKIRNGGLAAFVGPNVINNGLIEANLGKVQLASGDKFSVDLYGDGLLSLQASKEVNEQLVKNSGQIKANGGKVLLTAAAAESTVNSLINMDGLIEAQGVGKRNGQVVLTGKTVKVSGKINVSGKTSGGTVLVGGDYQGKGKTPTAQDTYISDTAEILADATENGNGGKVIIWADGTTVFNGRVRARGGKNGGNGGFVETSGKNIIKADGSVDASAAKGNNGSWLLDPANIRITNSAATADVLVSTIQSALNGGTDVNIATGSSGGGAGNITIESSISKTSGNNATLTLDAFGTIVTSSNVDITSTSNKLNVNMTAGGGITLGTNSDIVTNGGNVNLNSGGNIVLGNSSKITTAGGNIFLRSTATNGLINLSHNNSQLNSDKASSTADGDITLVAKSFSNSSGADGLVTGSARWLIYTEQATNNTLDGLTAGFTRYGCSYGGACTLGDGNGLIYSQYIGTLNVTPSSITIIYGDAIPSLVNYSYTLSGYNTGDAALDTVTGSLTGGTNYTQGSNIGNYAINYVSGSLSSLLGYGFTYANNPTAILVNQKTITAALTGAVSKVYDGSNTATLTGGNYSITGIYSSDDVSISNTAGTYDNKNAGTGKTVTVDGLALTGAKAGNYTLGTTTSVEGVVGEISKKDLTITATGQNKVYDGTRDASVTLADDRVSGDVFTTQDYATANFTDKNAAAGKTIDVDGISITGGDADNYNFNTTATTTANISKRDLTVSATADNKVYDGNRTATVTLTDDRVVGDVITDSYTTARFGNKNAGTGKTVTVNGISISGDDADNYNLVNTTATTLADITKYLLTITATADDKVYDGTRNAVAYLADDRIAGDVFDSSYTTARFGGKNVGVGKTVTVNGIDIAGLDARNYSFNTTATTTADVTPKALTITATADNKVYDGTRNAVAYLADDRIAGDVFDSSYTTARFGGKNVGIGKTVTVNGIDIVGTDARNYTFNITAKTTADVTPKALTISATGVNKVYDGNRSATVTLTDDRIAGDVFDSSYNRARFGGKNVGTAKTVNVFGIDIAGTDARNYTFNTTASTTADVTPRTLVVSATGEDKIYDGLTNAVVSLDDDRVAGDDLTSSYISADFEDRNAGADKLITVEGINFSGRDARNYVFDTTTTTTADITKRDLTVTADSQSKVYGSGDPRLTFSHDELQTGDTDGIFTGALTREAGENVADGPYEISQGTLDAGGNYNINFAGAELTITPYNLIVTADGKTKVYGAADPTLTYTYGRRIETLAAVREKERFNGLQNGDTADVFTGGLTRDAGEHVANGPYAINQGTLSAGANYTIEYVGAEMIITPASLNVSANDQTAFFGGTLPNLTYGVDGLVNGDTNSIFTGGLSTVETNSLPGEYGINQGSLDAGSDYVITYTPGTMTILSPLSDINSTLLQGLLNPVNGGGGNAGALLSLVLRGNGGGAGGNPLAGLETAAGGDGSENPQDLNNLNTAADGEEVVDLINCSKNSIEDKPCEI